MDNLAHIANIPVMQDTSPIFKKSFGGETEFSFSSFIFLIHLYIPSYKEELYQNYFSLSKKQPIGVFLFSLFWLLLFYHFYLSQVISYNINIFTKTPTSTILYMVKGSLRNVQNRNVPNWTFFCIYYFLQFNYWYR